jgi:hypothetical protein
MDVNAVNENGQTALFEAATVYGELRIGENG